MPVEHAAIIGAGISGLTAALALSRRGISSEIFEQAGELTDVGAGLQVSPNASRILAEFGILEGLSKVWLEPDAIRLISGSSLRQLAAVPAGKFARERWGAPYGVLHRTTLQKPFWLRLRPIRSAGFTSACGWTRPHRLSSGRPMSSSAPTASGQSFGNPLWAAPRRVFPAISPIALPFPKMRRLVSSTGQAFRLFSAVRHISSATRSGDRQLQHGGDHRR